MVGLGVLFLGLVSRALLLLFFVLRLSLGDGNIGLVHCDLGVVLGLLLGEFLLLLLVEGLDLRLGVREVLVIVHSGDGTQVRHVGIAAKPAALVLSNEYLGHLCHRVLEGQ